MSFLSKLARLKESLGVAEDQEVAEALGITKAAFSVRKKRGAFPDDRLYALVARRPELDVVYVLTGDKQLQGRTREALQATARMVGGMPIDDPSSQELLVRIAVDMATDKVNLRRRRRDQYERLLSSADAMTDASLGHLESIAERIAAADKEDALRALRQAQGLVAQPASASKTGRGTK